MKTKTIAVILFVDDEGRILLQDRSDMSKYGEEWGYFGGKIEHGETKEEALEREIREELEFSLSSYTYLGRYQGTGRSLKTGEKVRLVQEVFITRISRDEYGTMVQHEGAGKRWAAPDEAEKLNMKPLDPQILKDAKEHIRAPAVQGKRQA